ncbi:MAG: hypothetical protein ACP5JO_08720 [Candidatus Ratteibacteria bacterium]
MDIQRAWRGYRGWDNNRRNLDILNRWRDRYLKRSHIKSRATYDNIHSKR